MIRLGNPKKTDNEIVPYVQVDNRWNKQDKTFSFQF